MLRYGFFDSEITGYDEEGMPVFDRAESSDFLAMFISKIISDGVLAAPADCFQVVASEGMNLKVRPGFGIIRGRFAMDTQEFDITIPILTAPTTYKRIDRVVLRANYLQRLCEIVVKTGTPAGTPKPPELLQPASGDYYELCLATVAINSYQTVITQSNITDTRYDSSVCGVVTQVIDHIDTSVFYEQFNQFYDEFMETSDASYEQFISNMEEYLNALKILGDNQLNSVVQNMTAFEENAELQFQQWFQNVKDQLSDDVAGNLQNQINGLKERGSRILWSGVYYGSGSIEFFIPEKCFHNNAKNLTLVIEGTVTAGDANTGIRPGDNTSTISLTFPTDSSGAANEANPFAYNGYSYAYSGTDILFVAGSTPLQIVVGKLNTTDYAKCIISALGAYTNRCITCIYALVPEDSEEV